MKQYTGSEAIGTTFNGFFDTAKWEIFKLGVLQSYLDEDSGPSWQEWSGGNYEESMRLAHLDPRYQDWIHRCRESLAEVVRIQVTRDPPTPYQNWMTALFSLYEEAGAESFYTVAAERLGNIVLPSGDLVIFDGTKVLRWDYEFGSEGKVEGGTTWDIAEGDNIGSFLALRGIVMELATRGGTGSGRF